MFHVKHTIEEKNVSRETSTIADQIISANKVIMCEYADQLMWWNKKVNLISRSSTRQNAVEHIRHSLIPVALGVYSGKEDILDTGTGGGLPGIPLAIALPDHHLILNDISQKKCRVLVQLIKSLGLENCEVRCGDLGKLDLKEKCTITTMHAFKLKNLFVKSKRINWVRAIIYKGADFKDELDECLDRKLSIKAYDLSLLEPDRFYEGKFVLDVLPSDPTNTA